MGKMSRIVVLSLFTMAFAAGAEAREPVGIKIGVVGWYGWWDSDYLKKLMPNTVDPRMAATSYKINSAPLYGPLLSVDFMKQWSFSAVFACGNHFRASGDGFLFGTGYNGNFDYSRRSVGIFKYDLDATLSYSIIRYVKVFAGMKVQGYEGDGWLKVINPVTCLRSKNYGFNVLGYGPGIGFGVAAPLGENFFLLWNIAGIYMRTRDHLIQTLIGYLDGAWYERNWIDIILNVWGASSNLSFAYQVPTAPVTLSLGFRYQMLNFRVVKSDASQISTNPYPIYNLINAGIFKWGGRSIMNNSYDHFYGLVLQVIYAFTIQ